MMCVQSDCDEPPLEGHLHGFCAKCHRAWASAYIPSLEIGGDA